MINPLEEKIDMLTDIKIGRDKALRIFSEIGDNDPIEPQIMQRYFQYYFYDRAKEMDYPLSSRQIGRDDTLLNLLSENNLNCGSNPNSHLLQQSFMEAGKVFKTIDAPTEAIIVPFGKKGRKIIADLCSVVKDFNVKHYYELIKMAQRYSVNVYPNIFKKLFAAKAIHEIQEGEGIYYLNEQFYSSEFGMSIEKVSKADFLNI